jgi:hypothetical protein
LVAALLSLSSFASAQVTLTAQLTGAQETPPTTSTGNGLAVFTLDASRTHLSYDVVISGLSNVTAAHIHLGAPGVPGPIEIGLADGPFTHLTGSATVPEGLSNSILAGDTYINVHTAANPGGEIRGQVVRAPAGTFISELNGAEETPANGSTGVGIGIATLDAAKANVAYSLIVTGLTDITAAHFHTGAVGTPGPVIIPIASGPFDFKSGTAPITADQVAALESAGAYLNVHTAANPGGEIRGQLLAALSDVAPDSETDWKVPLSINTGVSGATIGQPVTIGTQAGASDDWAANEDLQGPARPPFTFASLAVIHSSAETGWQDRGGLYIQDLRAPITPGNSKTWSNLYATSDLGSPDAPATIIISWPDLSGISSALNFTFLDPDDVDHDGVTSYDMRKANSFSYTQGTTPTSPVINSQFGVTVTNSRAVPSPVISNVTVTQTGATSVTVTYTTDVASDTTLKFGTAQETLDKTVSNTTDLTTSHTVTFDNLTPNTKYFFQVSSAAPGLQPGTSEIMNVTTLNALTAAGQITAKDITASGATLTFGTSAPATAKVFYGTDQANLSKEIDLSAASATQSTALADLSPATQYFVKVVSSAAGYEDLVQTTNFTTLGALTANKPTVASITGTAAKVTVTTNQPSTVTLSYGTPDLTSAKTLTDDTVGTSHVFNLTGLTVGTTYQVQASATATGFGTAKSDVATFSTLNPIVITTGPTVTVTSSSASINVIADVDVTGQIKYGTTPDLGSVFTMPFAGKNQSAQLNGLQPNTTYYYQVTLNNPTRASITTATGQFTTTAAVTKGDANGDNKVDIADVTLALQFVVGLKTPTDLQKTSLDVVPVGAPDGIIDLRDVTRILRFSVGLETQL